MLDRHFTVNRPDRAWAGDITFIPTREGWLYVAVLLDLYSRKVVGWAMSDRQNRQLALDALVMAIERRQPEPGLIHHTDQGTLYATTAYREILRRHHMLPSMSRKGDCYDNAVAESFFSNLKNELTWDRDFKTRSAARSAIFEWIEVSITENGCTKLSTTSVRCGMKSRPLFLNHVSAETGMPQAGPINFARGETAVQEFSLLEG